MKKRYWLVLLFIILVIITYFAGPVPSNPTYSSELPEIPSDFNKLEEFIVKKEASLPVRENNEARIIWQNNKREKTAYSIVYLHGFAGSWRDAYPVNVKIADTIEANLFLARWAGHGLKPPKSLNNFSAELAWESAKEALMIGSQIGEKVIIMSTSTGGTLAVKLAATYPDKVHALINLSPNFQDDQPGTFVLNSPWGYEIANIISFGDNKKIDHEKEIAKQYWDTIYPSKALVNLQVLVESTMLPETFKNVKCPVLTLFYHENFFEEDEHVEVDFYQDVHTLFSTPDSLKVLKALDTPNNHFIGSDIKSQDVEIVEKQIVEFLKLKLEVEQL